MKKTSKIAAAFLLSSVMAVSLCTAAPLTAAASTLTINRDGTWDPGADSANAAYTYYKIFDAALSADGNSAAYTVDSAEKAAAIDALPMFSTDLGADGKYYITCTSTSGEDIAAALKAMVETNATLFPGITVTSDADPVVIDGLDDGYYLLEGSNGSALAVDTIKTQTITEKNDYPTIDKKQKKAAGTYADDELSIEVGSYIDYQVTVHIPANANKDIFVYDMMSDGLTYDTTTGLTASPAVDFTAVGDTDAGYDAAADWQIKIAPADYAAYKGSDIVFTYRAQVTDAALTDSEKENGVKLTYDNSNYILTDKVEYSTYFAGIYKVDPNDSSADMSGVKFALKDGDGAAVNVTYDAVNGYYVVDPSGSNNEVVTRADGTNYTIKIRGLDNDKTYTLTETETKLGYNLLNGTVALTKTEDTGTAFADKAANTYDKVENNKGTLLPSTGGIGTTIFYIIGGTLLLAAVVLLITKKRMNTPDQK